MKTLKEQRDIKEIFDFLDSHLYWGNIPIEENPKDCVFQQKDYIKLKYKFLNKGEI